MIPIEGAVRRLHSHIPAQDSRCSLPPMTRCPKKFRRTTITVRRFPYRRGKLHTIVPARWSTVVFFDSIPERQCPLVGPLKNPTQRFAHLVCSESHAQRVFRERRMDCTGQ